jgi:hypothetical protein
MGGTKRTARIEFPGGKLRVPADTPYEREILFEYVTHAARSCGCAALALDNQDLTVKRGAAVGYCWSCGKRCSGLIYELSGDEICARCARMVSAGRLKAGFFGTRKPPRRKNIAV